MRMRNALFLALLGCLISIPTHSAPPSYNLQISIGNEDNGTTSQNFTQLTGAFRYAKGLTRQTSLNFNADISTRQYNDTSSKDNNSLLLEGIYNYAPSKGFTASVYSLILRQRFETFDNSANDGSETSILLADFFRISENLSFVGGLEFIQSTTDIVDTSTQGLFAGLDYWLSDKLLGYINVKVQDEENTINLAALAASPARAQRVLVSGSHLPGEPGFQGNTGATAANTVAPTAGVAAQPIRQRNDSDNLFVTLGLNYEIDARQSIDFSIARFNYDTVTDTNIDQISLDYFWRF